AVMPTDMRVDATCLRLWRRAHDAQRFARFVDQHAPLVVPDPLTQRDLSAHTIWAGDRPIAVQLVESWLGTQREDGPPSALPCRFDYHREFIQRVDGDPHAPCNCFMNRSR